MSFRYYTQGHAGGDTFAEFTLSEANVLGVTPRSIRGWVRMMVSPPPDSSATLCGLQNDMEARLPRSLAVSLQ